jgi:hypothetical protein
MILIARIERIMTREASVPRCKSTSGNNIFTPIKPSSAANPAFRK